MIQFDTIENKKEDANGKINFFSNLSKINFASVIIEHFILIDEQLEMRPDILAYAAYGTVDNIDVLMKFNGLSSFDQFVTGKIIAIPALDSITKNTESIEISQIKNQRKKLLTSSEVFEIIAKRSPTSNFLPNKKNTVKANFSKTSNGILTF